jgi:hypothetical protein
MIIAPVPTISTTITMLRIAMEATTIVAVTAMTVTTTVTIMAMIPQAEGEAAVTADRAVAEAVETINENLRRMQRPPQVFFAVPYL